MTKIELAQLCSEVYEVGGGIPPTGWSIVCTSDDLVLSKNGFFAAVYVYKNPDAQKEEMVIAYRGTCLTEISNLVSDYDLWRQRMPSAQGTAEEFLAEILRKYPSSEKATHVGHSLGGFHAIMNALKNNQQAIVFDTPSVKKILQEVALSLDPTIISKYENNILTYLSAPNLINSGEQVGKIIQLELPDEVSEEIEQLKEKWYIKYGFLGGVTGYLAGQLTVLAHNTLRKHSITTIVAALDKHENEVAEFGRQRNLAKDILEKKRDELFAAQLTWDNGARQLEYQRDGKLLTLKNKVHDKMYEYKTKLSRKWEEHRDYISKHRNEERDFKEKHPRDSKGYDRLCRKNREKEKKDGDYITEEYGSVPGATRYVGWDNDWPEPNFSGGRQYYQIVEQYKKHKADLTQKYRVLIEQEKISAMALRENLGKAFNQSKAEFIKEWGEEGDCYDTDENGEYINQSERAKAIRNKHPQELRVMGAFAECIHIERLQGLSFSSRVHAEENDKDSENNELTTNIAQLHSTYERIFQTMQIAAKRYQNGEIDEEEYISQSQSSRIDDEQFMIISERIETNELSTEEIKAVLRAQRNILRSRHDFVLKDIISHKLEKIASYTNEADKNRDQLLLLFNEIEQRWLSIEKKNMHSHLLLKKAELAFQVEEYGIAAESYTAILNLLNNENDETLLSQSQALIQQLQSLISLCELLRDGGEIDADLRRLYEKILGKRDVISEISDKLEQKQEDYRTTLENLSFVQLGIDLAIKLFEKYEQQKAIDTPDKALSEPYVEVIHSAASVANQLTGITKHHIGDALEHLSNPTYDTVRELLDDLTPEEEDLVRDLFNPELSSDAAKANYKNFFTQHGGKFLYFKLSVAAFELGLKSCYAAYFQKKSHKKFEKTLSYEKWVSENVWGSVTSVLSGAKMVMNTLSQAQILNQLYGLISSGNISLNSVRDACIAMMNFPHLGHYINEYTRLPGEKVSTNWCAIFTQVLLENMNEGMFQQIWHVHDETSLKLMVRLLRKFEFSSGSAFWLSGKFVPILNSIFYARLTYHSYRASTQVYDIALERRIENIGGYLQMLESPESSRHEGTQCHTALLYENIKYTALALSNTHPFRCNLYITALFKQHQLNASFAITSVNSSICEHVLQAVSWYTEESSQELHCLMVSNSKKISASGSGASENYPEADVINTLAGILQRPICVVEGVAATNFFNSDCPKWDFDSFKVLRGDPIFIFYDTDRKKYHGLLPRGELYFEQQLKKKLTSKDRASETRIDFSPVSGTLQTRLSNLRNGMLRTGLIAAPEDTTSAQNANKGAAQKNLASKFGVL